MIYISIIFIVVIVLVLMVAPRFWQSEKKPNSRVITKEKFILAVVAQGKTNNPAIREFVELYNQIIADKQQPYLLADATVPEVVVPGSRVVDGKIAFDISPEALLTLKWETNGLRLWLTVNRQPFEAYLPLSSLRFLYSKKTGKGIEVNISAQPDASPA